MSNDHDSWEYGIRNEHQAATVRPAPRNERHHARACRCAAKKARARRARRGTNARAGQNVRMTLLHGIQEHGQAGNEETPPYHHTQTGMGRYRYRQGGNG